MEKHEEAKPQRGSKSRKGEVVPIILPRSPTASGCGAASLGREPLMSVADAARALNIHVWKLRRAAKTGLVPSYQFLNSRRLVRLSEVIAAIETSRCGGEK